MLVENYLPNNFNYIFSVFESFSQFTDWKTNKKHCFVASTLFSVETMRNYVIIIQIKSK